MICASAQIRNDVKHAIKSGTVGMKFYQELAGKAASIVNVRLRNAQVRAWLLSVNRARFSGKATASLPQTVQELLLAVMGDDLVFGGTKRARDMSALSMAASLRKTLFDKFFKLEVEAGMPELSDAVQNKIISMALDGGKSVIVRWTGNKFLTRLEQVAEYGSQQLEPEALVASSIIEEFQKHG